MGEPASGEQPAVEGAAVLPAGSRVVHIGPPKTATTALQAAFHEAREVAEAHGVHYAGSSRHSASAVAAAIGLSIVRQDVPPRSRWAGLLREIRTSSASRVVLSSEYLAHASPEAIRQLVDDLDPGRVQVVVTLRSIGAILPSHWQQVIGHGTRASFEPWLRRTLDAARVPDPAGFWFWQRHDHLVERWAAAVGPDRVTVIVVDPRDHRAVLDAMERLVGLPGGTLPLVRNLENRSLTVAEAETIRSFNEQYRAAGLDMVAYGRFVTMGAARFLKQRTPGPEEPRITLPTWAFGDIETLEAETVERIRASGVRVVGSLDLLHTRFPEVPAGGIPGDATAGADPRSPVLVPACIAGGFALAVARAAGLTTRRDVGTRAFVLGGGVEPGETAAVSTLALAAVIIHRCLRRVRGLARRRPGGDARGRSATRHDL